MQGYNNYRGRGSLGKTLLSIFLILIIIAAGVILWLQRYVVYDDAGNTSLVLPSKEKDKDSQGTSADLEDEELIIVVPEEVSPQKEKHAGFWLREEALTVASWEEQKQQIPDGVKDIAVYCKLKSQILFPSTLAAKGTSALAKDTQEAMDECLKSGYRTIAVIDCFNDSKVANNYVQKRGLQNTGSYIFYDGENRQWLDPGKEEARVYLCGLIQEAASLGFQEVLLTNVTYPTVGKLDKIDYGEKTPEENISAFLEDVRETLQDTGVQVSILLPDTVIQQGTDEAAGLSLEGVCRYVDCIYAETVLENAEELGKLMSKYSSVRFCPILSESPEQGSYMLKSQE